MIDVGQAQETIFDDEMEFWDAEIVLTLAEPNRSDDFRYQA